VNPAKSLKLTLFGLFGVTLAFTLLLLAFLEHGSIDKLQTLSESVANFDQKRMQEDFGLKALDMISPLAVQMEDSGLDLDEEVQGIGNDSVVRALFSSGRLSQKPSHANRKGKAENIQQALNRLAAPKKGIWSSAQICDKEGNVVASWPPASPAEKELKIDPSFVQMKSGAVIPGMSVRSWMKSAQNRSLTKEGKPAPGAKAASFESLVSVATGLEDAGGNFVGMVRVQEPVENFYGLDPQRTLKGITDFSAKASVILQRGDGEQVLNSVKGDYIENSASIPDLKDTLAAMQAKSTGWDEVKSYDGKPAIVSWKRVGSWSESQGASNLFTLCVLIPEEGIKAVVPSSGDKPAHFYSRPIIWGLLLLVFGLPLGLGLVLLQNQVEPLRRLMDVASQIDEFGVAPEGLEFREELDPDLSQISQSLNALLRRALASDHRAHELDAALRRAEDQSSRDATTAAQELSELRSKLASAENEKSAANAKFDASQKAKADVEAQLVNLKSALETAQRSIDLKNSENKNLSSQILDLMRTLEEQRKVAQQVQESSMRRDDELVRLSAVNTLSSELKATLTVIKNYISTMLGSVGAISDAQQEFLGVVINKSARLERLIADLVELSEIGSGIKPPHIETLSMGALVQEALLNTRPQADHKKIALEFAESGNIPSVSVDREKIGAVIRALLSQAVKVTSRGERVSILVGARENSVELRFSDPGMSLPPDRAAKVFNQFHGVDSQAGPEFIGTGLRFPIMRAIVEAHGGKIYIESQVGRGKTFVISIPKAGAFTPAPARPTPPNLTPAASPAPASKPDQNEVAKFDSIFGEMPASPSAAAPFAPTLASLAPPAGVPAPPKVLSPLAPSTPALPSLPSLGGAPVLTPPAPLAPLAPPKPLAPPVPPAVKLPGLSPLAPPAIGGSPAPLEFKTEAANVPLAEKDKSNFDAIFGGLPAQALDGNKLGGLPKVELKTDVALGEADKASFDSIFGATPTIPAPKPVGPPPALGAVPAPPPPPPSSKPAIPADLGNFDAIFGGAPSGNPPPPPAPIPAPKPVGPPPALGAVPAPPPSAAKPAMPVDLANFDAIFGGTPAPPPKPLGSGQPLNTMDDLKNMLGGL
jgi:signal transduction histidine kinase